MGRLEIHELMLQPSQCGGEEKHTQRTKPEAKIPSAYIHIDIMDVDEVNLQTYATHKGQDTSSQAGQ